MGVFRSAFGYVDRRYRLRGPLQAQLNKVMPGHLKWTNCLGGMTLICFVVQVVTGVLLAFNYKPTMDEAYLSVQRIMTEVPFGAFVRSLHAWTSNFMILLVTLHLLKVFFMSAYRPPREFTWVSGVALFFITLFFGFSGYLLPMNQLSYWATTVGTEIAGAFPLVGEQARLVLLGGPRVSGETLTRFYALHVLLLPMASAVFLAGHFLMIRRQGISEPL